MLKKTKGIVLNFVKYRESSVIVKIYTEQLGLISGIVNSVRSKTGKTHKIALYQPLTFLDLVVYDKNNQNIKRISEAKIDFPFHSIPFSFQKSSIGMFLTEFLSKVLREEEGNEHLYQFLSDSISHFDEQEENFANFHLIFLLQLAEFLGLGISSTKDLLEQIGIPDFDEQSIRLVNQLLEADYDDFIEANGKTRNQVLQWLIKFYQLHLENFGEIKSLEVLKEVLS